MRKGPSLGRLTIASFEEEERRRIEEREKLLEVVRSDITTSAWKGSWWKHKKRGSVYRYWGSAEVQSTRPIQEGDFVEVYEATNGKLWVRPGEEFFDGRFERGKIPTFRLLGRWLLHIVVWVNLVLLTTILWILLSPF